MFGDRCRGDDADGEHQEVRPTSLPLQRVPGRGDQCAERGIARDQHGDQPQRERQVIAVPAPAAARRRPLRRRLPPEPEEDREQVAKDGQRDQADREVGRR